MLNAPIYNVNSRSLSRLISNAGFRKLMLEDDYKKYGSQVKSVLQKGGVPLEKKCSIKSLLDTSYDHLLKQYRHEYVYKTTLLSEYVLKQFSLESSVILNEFKINKSIADLVLVNGTNKVFEIKTELDSPERLKSQLTDYYKAFSEVYIVTHHSLEAKYLSIIDKEVGLMVFNEDNTISLSRPAVFNTSFFDNIAMMKAMRKSEYVAVLKNLCGFIPETTQFNFFKECLKMAECIDAESFQQEFLRIIKTRIKPEHLLVSQSEIPNYLKFSCYLLNLKENTYLSLQSRLSCLV